MRTIIQVEENAAALNPEQMMAGADGVVAHIDSEDLDMACPGIDGDMRSRGAVGVGCFGAIRE